MSASHHLDLPFDVLLAVLHSHGRRISRLQRRRARNDEEERHFLRYPPRWCESRWLMYDERSWWVLVCLPVCPCVYVCVSEEKTRKERNHILDFLLGTRFIILLLFLWQNFICRARREDVKAFSVRFYRRLLVCGCQKYDNVDGSRRGVVNSFILYFPYIVTQK